MGLSLRPEHLKRYKDLAWLLVKYGRSDLTHQMGLDKAIRDFEKPTAQTHPKAAELPRDLERLGPTYVKLGQFLSTRSDLFPAPYMEALARLQDNLEPFSFEQVEEILRSELGLRVSRVFSEFDEAPIAAASLAQVHRAVLKNGRLVAVKVQRPHIRERIIKDLDAFEDIAEFLDRHTATGRRFMLQATLGEFRKAVLRELDFRQEAQNLILLANNLRHYDHIVIPSPVEDYTTGRVLTMDYIRGKKVVNFTPLERLLINGHRLAEELFKAYMQQILIDGFYHADPHPGNVFITEEGRIALLDLGMVARVSEDLQRKLIRLLLAISEGRSGDAVEYAIELSDQVSGFNKREFSKRVNELVTRYQKVTIEEIEVGRVVLEVFRIAGENGIRFPAELAMMGKSLLNLDNIGRSLDPAFEPNAAIRSYAAELLRRKIRKGVSAASLFEVVMDSKEFLQFLPKRVNKIMAALANNDLKLNVEAIDEKYLMTGFQKVANRLTLGLILAAIIIGAALMMRVETSFRIFGYPGLAIIFFLLAAIGGFLLAVVIIYQDERMSKKDDGSSI